MDIGGVKPGYHEGGATRIWSCPIECYVSGTGQQLNVAKVYVDEGVLVIDVEPTVSMEE